MYFGTDGIRGVANRQITAQLAHACGNALCGMRRACRVVVGRDTRVSGDMLAHALAAGVMQGGGEVVDVGIMPTAGVAFLSRIYNADFGVVISASHNPPEYNGIKVFGGDGYKLGEEEENEIEELMSQSFSETPCGVGRYRFMHNAADVYVSELVKHGEPLKGMRFLLDCSNGAAAVVAPRVFAFLGADVTVAGDGVTGQDINVNAGALHAELLRGRMKEGYDAAFAYDGDSDRLISLDEKGNLVDGDMALAILARDFLQRGLLGDAPVVGTSNSNAGIEKDIRALGVGFLRADVGDKYVLRMMRETGAKLGAEQSGHIIIADWATTGDGILSSVALAGIMRRTCKTLGELNFARPFPQANRDVVVRDKMRLINNESLFDAVEKERGKLGADGRLLVRASGTEPKLRVLAECADRVRADAAADALAAFIGRLNSD